MCACVCDYVCVCVCECVCVFQSNYDVVCTYCVCDVLLASCAEDNFKVVSESSIDVAGIGSDTLVNMRKVI